MVGVFKTWSVPTIAFVAPYLLLITVSNVSADFGDGWKDVLQPLQDAFESQHVLFSPADLPYTCGIQMNETLQARYPWARPSRSSSYCSLLQKYNWEIEQAIAGEQRWYVALFGDSLFQCGRWPFAPCRGADVVFQQHLAKYNYWNLAAGGDTTASMMWRLIHADEVPPEELGTKVAVLWVGSNDMSNASITAWDRLDELIPPIVTDIVTIAHWMTQVNPELKVVVMGFLPPSGNPSSDSYEVRYAQPSFGTQPVLRGNQQMQDLIAQVNEAEETDNLMYLDCWTVFLLPDGNINPTYTIDAVHPSAAGWDALFSQCLGPVLQSILEW